MKLIKRLYLILTLMLCFTAIGEAQEYYDYRTYTGYSGSTVYITWDPSPDERTEFYEVASKHFESNTFSIEGSTVDNKFGAAISHSGHYIFFVRARSSTNESVWISSIDEDMDGIKPWWYYAYLAPPGDITY